MCECCCATIPWNDGVLEAIGGAARASPPDEMFWPVAGERGTLAARWRSLGGKRWN